MILHISPITYQTNICSPKVFILSRQTPNWDRGTVLVSHYRKRQCVMDIYLIMGHQNRPSVPVISVPKLNGLFAQRWIRER